MVDNDVDLLKVVRAIEDKYRLRKKELSPLILVYKG